VLLKIQKNYAIYVPFAYSAMQRCVAVAAILGVDARPVLQ